MVHTPTAFWRCKTRTELSRLLATIIACVDREVQHKITYGDKELLTTRKDGQGRCMVDCHMFLCAHEGHQRTTKLHPHTTYYKDPQYTRFAAPKVCSAHSQLRMGWTWTKQIKITPTDSTKLSSLRHLCTFRHCRSSLCREESRLPCQMQQKGKPRPTSPAKWRRPLPSCPRHRPRISSSATRCKITEDMAGWGVKERSSQ